MTSFLICELISNRKSALFWVKLRIQLETDNVVVKYTTAEHWPAGNLQYHVRGETLHANVQILAELLLGPVQVDNKSVKSVKLPVDVLRCGTSFSEELALNHWRDAAKRSWTYFRGSHFSFEKPLSIDCEIECSIRSVYRTTKGWNCVVSFLWKMPPFKDSKSIAYIG